MKNSNATKLLSVLLTIVLLISAFTANVFASKAAEDIPSATHYPSLTETSKDDIINLAEGELPVPELKDRQLPKEDKPEGVSFKSIENNGHVNRLRAQEESLNEIIFQNRDGTKTMYCFTSPVKYVASDGTIRDKKTTLSSSVDKKELQSDYAYTNPENDVRVYFPKKLSEASGVLLKSKSVEIEMSPVSFKGASATKNIVSKDANQISSLKTTYATEDGEEKDAILFNNVFGPGISVRYASQFDGYKEDIIISKYNGINEFVFKIKTNGLALIKLEDGNLVFVNPKDKAVLASLGNLMLYDSSVDGNGYDKYTRASLYQHYYSVSEAKENNEYLVTIHVDEEYLKSESTVYPVYVGPSLTSLDGNDLVITEPNAYVNQHIQTSYTDSDGYIYNGYTLIRVGNSGTEELGSYRGLIDFNSLESESAAHPLAGKRVLSANLYIRDLFPSISAMSVGLYPITVGWTNQDIWSKFDTNNQCGETQFLYWNQGVAAIGDTYDNSVGHWYYFDVKDYVSDILKAEASFGLMLKGVNDFNEAKDAHTFAGAGYLADFSLRPALVIEYEDLTFVNSNTENSIPLCASFSNVNENTYGVTDVNIKEMSNVSSSSPIYFTFAATANVEYYFKSVGQWTSDVTVWIYNNKGRFFDYSGRVPQFTFKSAVPETYIIRIIGTSTTTSGKFLMTRDYTNDTQHLQKGTMVAFYDKSFMGRYNNDAQKAQAAITGYFEYIRKNMLKYFNVELTYTPEQYSQYEDSFSSNSENNNSFNDFYFDAYRLHSDAAKALDVDTTLVYAFVFTGETLEYTPADEPYITHLPENVDCTWRENVIFITRQNHTIGPNECITDSSLHELLHNFGTVDHYCGTLINPNCDNDYCFQHGEHEEYKFDDIEYIRHICVMHSPINYDCKGNLCGLCIRDVFNTIKVQE